MLKAGEISDALQKMVRDDTKRTCVIIRALVRYGRPSCFVSAFVLGLPEEALDTKESEVPFIEVFEELARDGDVVKAEWFGRALWDLSRQCE